MSKIKWANDVDERKIHNIAKRAQKISKGFTKGRDLIDITMDLSACHANGCPLDLDKLANADDFNLLHDVVGIANHIDRKTGKLTQCFLPRCSK